MLAELLLSSFALVRSAVLVLIAGYGLCYGILEAAGRARPAPPGSSWQVPATWVRGASRRRRFMVWGALLGPGFATRNPYAGFWILPLAIAAVPGLRYGLLLAAVIGAAHSTGRVLGLLHGVPDVAVSSYLASALRSMYWRMADGFALLALAGAAAMTFAFQVRG